MAGYGGSWAYLAWRRDAELLRKAAPWLAMGAFSLASAVMITLARSRMEVPLALSDRYISATLYLPLALIFLYLVLARDWAARRTVNWTALLGPALGGALAMALVSNWMDGFRQMHVAQAEHLQRTARLHFVKLFTAEGMEDMYPSPVELQKLTLQLAQQDLLREVDLFESDLLDDCPIKRSENPVKSTQARFKSLARTDTGGYIAGGFISRPGMRALADAVVLTWRPAEARISANGSEDAGEHIFAVEAVTLPWWALGKVNKATKISWEVPLPLERLPAGREVVIRAYAMDQKRRRLTRMEGAFRFSGEIPTGDVAPDAP